MGFAPRCLIIVAPPQLDATEEMSMPTQEIPRPTWATFFDTFTRQHEGWLATLEIFDPEAGAQEEVHELPLEGVSVSSEADKSESIAINFGKTTEDHVIHTVTGATHVWLEQTSEGANAALEIESGDKTKTLLRFRSPLPAEFVDGVVSP
jgi:hypothetical protein